MPSVVEMIKWLVILISRGIVNQAALSISFIDLNGFYKPDKYNFARGGVTNPVFLHPNAITPENGERSVIQGDPKRER
jgi:hypothetical protein